MRFHNIVCAPFSGRLPYPLLKKNYLPLLPHRHTAIQNNPTTQTPTTKLITAFPSPAPASILLFPLDAWTATVGVGVEMIVAVLTLVLPAPLLPDNLVEEKYVVFPPPLPPLIPAPLPALTVAAAPDSSGTTVITFVVTTCPCPWAPAPEPTLVPTPLTSPDPVACGEEVVLGRSVIFVLVAPNPPFPVLPTPWILVSTAPPPPVPPSPLPPTPPVFSGQNVTVNVSVSHTFVVTVNPFGITGAV